MLQMGFSQEEIQDSLVNQKYNDVMAAYLLLDYRNSEVCCFCLTATHLYFTQHHAGYYWFVSDSLATVTLMLYSQLSN